MTFSYWDERPVLFAKDTWMLVCREAVKRNIEPEDLIEQALLEYLKEEDSSE